MLYHERLDVYQLSIELVAWAIPLSEEMPKGFSSLGEQLRRAVVSIPLNIAEGVGKPTRADQARFHGIARGSAMEVGAILDVMAVLLGKQEHIASAKEKLVRVVEMLTKMCR